MIGAKWTVIIERDALASTSDVEGRQVAVTTRSQTCGSFNELSASEQYRAAQYAQDVTAAGNVPPGTDVRVYDRLVMDGTLNPCLPAQLRGTWVIEFVHYTRPRLRLLCKRIITGESDA